MTFANTSKLIHAALVAAAAVVGVAAQPVNVVVDVANYGVGPCATDVTKKLNVTKYQPVAVRGGLYQQTVLLQNTSANPITGIMTLILEQLPSNTQLLNRAGLTKCGTDKSMKSFVTVDIGADAALNPGQTAQVVLNFDKQQNFSFWSANVRAGVAIRRQYVQGDFDGDGKADLAFYQSGNHTFTVKRSSDDQSMTFSMPGGNMPVIGDYDGDGKADFATWDYSKNTRYIHMSSNNSDESEKDVANYPMQAWAPYFYPAPADYDGDGITDWAVYDANNGMYVVHYSLSGQTVNQGMAVPAGWKPAPFDYDGDGAANLALFHPYTGAWKVLGKYSVIDLPAMTPIANQQTHTHFTIPADYDGDGVADRAEYNVEDGKVTMQMSSNPAQTLVYAMGTPGASLAASADFDGDGKMDRAIFTPGTNNWTIVFATGGSKNVSFGSQAQNDKVATPYLAPTPHFTQN